MAENRFKQAILARVLGPIKATELIALIAKEDPELFLECSDLSLLFNQLTAEGKWIEIEYVLPDMDYRVKSIFFPKGTKIEVLQTRKAA